MPNAFPSLDEFAQLPHAVSLLGMSGVGKTMLSKQLRRDDNWFHYSADYRIGTAYLAEHIIDNIKFRIMRTDAFVADLLRSDSIYINHNISVDNLDPVSTYLGMFGDPKHGGLDKATFLERQQQYRAAEISSMQDVPRFMEKAWRISATVRLRLSVKHSTKTAMPPLPAPLAPWPPTARSRAAQT